MKNLPVLFLTGGLAMLCTSALCEGYKIRCVTETRESKLTQWGTCVAVGKGMVATAWHVVERATCGSTSWEQSRIEVQQSSGEWCVASIHTSDVGADVAILDVADGWCPLVPVKLADEKACEVAVSDHAKDIRIRKVERATFTIRCTDGQPGDHGNSGAPVIQGGRLIGIVTGLVSDGSIQCADVSVVRRLMKEVAK